MRGVTMELLELTNRTGVAARLDVLGEICNGAFGRGSLRFSASRVSCNDIELPCRAMETPTLRIDHSRSAATLASGSPS